MQPLPDIDERRHLTKRAVEYIHARILRKSLSEIAEDVGIGEKTVRLVASERLSALNEMHHASAPFYLGIESLRIAGQFRPIFTDLAGRKVVDIGETFGKKSIQQRLRTLRNNDQIRAVLTGANRKVRDAVLAELGRETRIAIDKFYVLQAANRAVDVVRKHAASTKPSKGQRFIMRSRHILLKRNAVLKPEELRTLEAWIGEFPELKVAYEIKEELHFLYDIEDAGQAAFALNAWQRRVSNDLGSPFGALSELIADWRSEVLELWNHRIVIDYAEEMRRVAQGICHDKGKSSFEVVRARALFRDRLV
jgi:transposase